MGVFSRRLKKQMKDIDLDNVLNQGQTLFQAKQINRSINKKEKKIQQVNALQSLHNSFIKPVNNTYEDVKDKMLQDLTNNIDDNNTIDITNELVQINDGVKVIKN